MSGLDVFLALVFGAFALGIGWTVIVLECFINRERGDTMIGLLMRLGLSPGMAKVALRVGGIVLVLLALWWLRNDAYNDGVRATDAKWEQASAKLQEEALKAAAKASSKADARAIEYMEKVEAEKEKLDEAERTGASSFDVLFGPGDGVRD